MADENDNHLSDGDIQINLGGNEAATPAEPNSDTTNENISPNNTEIPNQENQSFSIDLSQNEPIQNEPVQVEAEQNIEPQVEEPIEVAPTGEISTEQEVIIPEESPEKTIQSENTPEEAHIEEDLPPSIEAPETDPLKPNIETHSEEISEVPNHPPIPTSNEMDEAEQKIELEQQVPEQGPGINKKKVFLKALIPLGIAIVLGVSGYLAYKYFSAEPIEANPTENNEEIGKIDTVKEEEKEKEVEEIMESPHKEQFLSFITTESELSEHLKVAEEPDFFMYFKKSDHIFNKNFVPPGHEEIAEVAIIQNAQSESLETAYVLENGAKDLVKSVLSLNENMNFDTKGNVNIASNYSDDDKFDYSESEENEFISAWKAYIQEKDLENDLQIFAYVNSQNSPGELGSILNTFPVISEKSREEKIKITELMAISNKVALALEEDKENINIMLGINAEIEGDFDAAIEDIKESFEDYLYTGLNVNTSEAELNVETDRKNIYIHLQISKDAAEEIKVEEKDPNKEPDKIKVKRKKLKKDKTTFGTAVQARDMARISNLQSLAAAIEVYNLDHGYYPKTETALCLNDKDFNKLDTGVNRLGEYLQGGLAAVQDPSKQEIPSIGSNKSCEGSYVYVPLDGQSLNYALYAKMENEENGNATEKMIPEAGDSSSQVTVGTKGAYYLIEK